MACQDWEDSQVGARAWADSQATGSPVGLLAIQHWEAVAVNQHSGDFVEDQHWEVVAAVQHWEGSQEGRWVAVAVARWADSLGAHSAAVVAVQRWVGSQAGHD